MTSISKLKPFHKIDIIRKCTGFTATQKLLLFIIASHLGNNEFSFLSLTTLQKETGLSRTAITDNLRLLLLVDVIWKIDSGKKYRSNRYGINFSKLVVLDYQCSSLGLLGWSPRTTRVVVSDYPKGNIKGSKEIKEDPSSKNNSKIKSQKAIKEIRIKLNLKGKHLNGEAKESKP
jgi:hypothetical protein